MSSSSPRPYKSQLFNLINRQSMQWRDRLGQAVRHLKIAAEWSVQALVIPLFWLLQNGRIAGNPLGTGTSEEQPPLGAAATTEEDCASALSDRPLDRILDTLEPWLAETIAIDLSTPTQSSATVSPAPWETLWQKIQKLNPLARSASPHLLPAATNNSTDNSASNPISLAKFLLLAQEPTFTEQESQWWVRGIATHLASRQLVLVTPGNQTLDLLSEVQQKRLQKRIRLEMANYGYERRRQLASQQKILGLISAVSPQSGEILPPVDLLWQSLRWLQTQEMAIAAQQWSLSVLKRSSLPVLPQTLLTIAHQSSQHWQITSHLAQSSRPTLALPAATISSDSPSELISPSFSLYPLPISDLIQAAIRHFFGSTAQTTLPSSPESLAAASVQQSRPVLGSVARLPQQFPALFAKSLTPVQALLGSAVDDRLSAIKNPSSSEPSDPFQIQHILWAAIADLSRQNPGTSPSQNRSIQSILAHKLRSLLQKVDSHQMAVTLPTFQDQALDDPWLLWEDLYPEPPLALSASSAQCSAQSSALVAVLTLPSPIPSLERLTDAFPQNIKRSRSSKSLQKKTKNSQKLAKTTINSDNLLQKTATTPHPLSSAATEKPIAQAAIDFNPDWIDIGSESLGYVKHPLEILLEILDWVILAIETAILRVWHRIKERWHSTENRRKKS
jgi:hypothetical protein